MVASALLASACGGSSSASPDGGDDGAIDGRVEGDAGSDAGHDAGVQDAAADVAIDAAVDVATDTGSADDAGLTDAASVGDGGAPDGGSAADCAALGAKLRATIDMHYANAPAQTVGGASVAVIRGNCRWLGAVGEAHTGVPMTTGHMFRVASITKTFVAATLLRLAEEGRVSLDATVDRYVAGIPGGDVMTVRMLLNHTNGLFDYTTDAAFWNTALAQPTLAVTPQSLIDVSLTHAPTFAPGQGYAYTNTGFILAGMVLESAAGTTASVAIRQRTFAAAGLNDTYFDGEEALPAPLATGFGSVGEDVTNALHPSVNWTAGSVVTTAGDLADWAKALYGGSVLNQSSLAEMLTPVDTGAPGLYYGLGASLYDASRLGNFGPGVGHGGRLPGYRSDMLYMRNDGTVIVQMGNAELGKNYTGVLLLALYGP